MSPSRRPPSVSQTVLKLLINKAFTQVNNHINCGSDGFPPKEPSRQLGLGRRQRKQENGVPEKCDVSQHGRQDQTPHDVKAGPRGQGGKGPQSECHPICLHCERWRIPWKPLTWVGLVHKTTQEATEQSPQRGSPTWLCDAVFSEN